MHKCHQMSMMEVGHRSPWSPWRHRWGISTFRLFLACLNLSWGSQMRTMHRIFTYLHLPQKLPRWRKVFHPWSIWGWYSSGSSSLTKTSICMPMSTGRSAHALVSSNLETYQYNRIMQNPINFKKNQTHTGSWKLTSGILALGMLDSRPKPAPNHTIWLFNIAMENPL